MPPRVLLIGIDGAPYSLVSKWAGEGKLPNFKIILAEAAHGILKSPIDITPPAWSSIYTGKNPGKHGIFDFMGRKKGRYDFAPINSSQRDAQDVWEILSQEGLRVCVLNAPLSFPPRKVNGVLVGGFLTPGESVEYTYPEDLKEELKENIPGFEHSASDELQLNLNKDAYIRNEQERLTNIGKAALYLIRKERFDFFSVFFSETDHVQHWFWDHMEDEERNGKRSRYSNVILDTYKNVDKIIGELLHEIDDNTYVMLVSDHGGAPLRRFFHTNYFLHSIGMLQFRRSLKSRFRLGLYSIGVSQALYRFLLRRKIYWLRYALIPITLSLSDVDWDRTSAFSLGYGQIYLNVEGREIKGTVKQSEYEHARKEIVDQISRIGDGHIGATPIQHAWTQEEAFSGPHISEAPDIQLLMAEGYEAFPWSSIADRMFTDGIDRSGTHNPDGLVIIKGQEVVGVAIENASVVDIAPTILNLMGVRIPEDMDGRVLSQAFTSDHQSKNPVLVRSSTPKETIPEYKMTEDEQQKIEDNLRSLGYI